MRRYFLPLVLGLTSLLAGAAGAQATKVRVLALKSGDFPELFLRGAEAHLPIRFSNIQPGEVMPALRANPLPIYRRDTNDEGEEIYVVAHKVKLPSGSGGILLLAWKAGDELRFVAIEDNFGSARYNDWLLINTGARPIAFKVGEDTKPIIVKPGSSSSYRIRAEKGSGATVLAQAPFDGESKTFFSTFWPVYANKRTIVLFVDDGEKIRVKRISDKVSS